MLACQLKDEADKFNQELFDKITKLTEKVELTGEAVQESDIERWNIGAVKSGNHEKDLEKIHAALSLINADQFLKEMKNLNV